MTPAERDCKRIMAEVKAKMDAARKADRQVTMRRKGE